MTKVEEKGKVRGGWVAVCQCGGKKKTWASIDKVR